MPPPAARSHPRPVGASNVVFATDSYDQRWLMLTGQLPNTYHILHGGLAEKPRKHAWNMSSLSAQQRCKKCYGHAIQCSTE